MPAIRRCRQLLGARYAGVRPIRTTLRLPTASSVAAVDPSEAVRWADIVSFGESLFEVVE